MKLGGKILNSEIYFALVRLEFFDIFSDFSIYYVEKLTNLGKVNFPIKLFLPPFMKTACVK